MFWERFKKNNIKNNKKDKNYSGAHFVVIPDIFYGGKDPLIYREPQNKKEPKPKEKVLKKMGEPSQSWSKKKFLILGVSVLIIFIAGAAYYYFNQVSVSAPRSSVKVETERPVEEKEPEVAEAPRPTEEVEPKPPEEPAPEEIEEPARPLVFPRVLLRDSADLDIDSLTDAEEEVFGTDSGIWDTDGDGYYDGQEVLNLYNPRGFAPVKLIDSGLVREYTNPSWQYRVYYPIVWEAAEVDAAGNHVLFSSITGDFIEIRAFPRLAEESFPAWFGRNISGEKFSDLFVITNRFKIDGYKRTDDLVAYFAGDSAVFVIIYQPAGAAVDIPFRHIMQMMFQSFRPSEIFTQLPEQTVLPSAS